MAEYRGRSTETLGVAMLTLAMSLGLMALLIVAAAAGIALNLRRARRLRYEATCLADRWTTFGPTSHEGDRWEFELTCADQFRIPLLTWAHCSALNYGPSIDSDV